MTYSEDKKTNQEQEIPPILLKAFPEVYSKSDPKDYAEISNKRYLQALISTIHKGLLDYDVPIIVHLNDSRSSDLTRNANYLVQKLKTEFNFSLLDTKYSVACSDDDNLYGLVLIFKREGRK